MKSEEIKHNIYLHFLFYLFFQKSNESDFFLFRKEEKFYLCAEQISLSDETVYLHHTRFETILLRKLKKKMTLYSHLINLYFKNPS